jgi:tetratricopeptide (TPR) repeat protein
MSLTADVAVAAAERVEKSAGPAAGLALFRRLASNASGTELRARAILGGLRCAIPVRDLGAIRDLALLWQTVDEGVWDGIFVACKDLWRAGLGVCAVNVAHAEMTRLVTARALYMYARALDVAGDSRAAPAFRAAFERAEKEGANALMHTCRVRRAAWLACAPETLSEAIEEAKKVSVAETTRPERLVLARILLRSPSRFARASAIGLLDDLVSRAGGLDDLARRALVLAARHADDMADDLTPLEVDRLLALFARESIAKEAAPVRDAIRAIDRLARAKEKKSDAELDAALALAARSDPELAILHARARDILRGRFEPALAASTLAERPVLGAGSYPLWTAMLDAVVALRDSAWPRAAHALRWLADVAERGERTPPSLWSIAQAALGTDDVEVRAVAGRLVAAMMKVTSAAPPRGWLGLAQALTACGMNELATVARRSAALAKEPGAVEALVLALTRSGWALAESGDRTRALERLREARSLSTGA